LEINSDEQSARWCITIGWAFYAFRNTATLQLFHGRIAIVSVRSKNRRSIMCSFVRVPAYIELFFFFQRFWLECCDSIRRNFYCCEKFTKTRYGYHLSSINRSAFLLRMLRKEIYLQTIVQKGVNDFHRKTRGAIKTIPFCIIRRTCIHMECDIWPIRWRWWPRFWCRPGWTSICKDKIINH